MKKHILVCLILLGMIGCLEIEKIRQPCTVFLKDGSTLEIKQDIRRNTKSGIITYRDIEGRLWSIYETEYDSLVCGPQ